ncbi:MAG: choice-of-anchor R domain-containing protein [Candidatus Sulfomarinibacteraceae bacterium]
MSKSVACVRVSVLAAVVCLLAPPLMAQTTLISNLPGNDATQSAGLSDLRVKGMGFTMPAGDDYILDHVTLRLETNGAVPAPIIELWTNSGGQLGSLVETLTNPTLAASGIAEYDFASAGATLTAGAGYWIVAYGPAGAPTYSWKASSPAQVPTGLATHLGALWGTSGPPPTSTSSIVCSYSVTATLVPVELQSFTIE